MPRAGTVERDGVTLHHGIARDARPSSRPSLARCRRPNCTTAMGSRGTGEKRKICRRTTSIASTMPRPRSVPSASARPHKRPRSKPGRTVLAPGRGARRRRFHRARHREHHKDHDGGDEQEHHDGPEKHHAVPSAGPHHVRPVGRTGRLRPCARGQAQSGEKRCCSNLFSVHSRSPELGKYLCRPGAIP